MTLAEYNALPPLTSAPKCATMENARAYRLMAETAYRSASGADVSESAPLYDAIADLLDAAADGRDALGAIDARWRAYCATANQAITQAPKIERGPMSGMSSAHYRYASPEAFRSLARSLGF